MESNARKELPSGGYNWVTRSLVVLVLAATLPLMIFGTGVAWFAISQKREAVTGTLTGMASALRVAVDRELLSQFRAMELLASNAQLFAQPDLKAFEARARQIIGARVGWRNVVLIDPASHTIVASGLPLPSPAPKSSVGDEVDGVARTGKPTVAGIIGVGKVTQEPIVLLLAPIHRDGAVRFVLAVAMDPRPLSDIFAEQRLAESWTGAIVDPHFLLAGRSRQPEKFLGKAATPSLTDRIKASDRGLFTALNQEGAKVYTVFDRSPITGFSVAIGVPAAEVEQPTTRALLALGGVACALLAVALALTGWVARGIVRRRDAYENAIRATQDDLHGSLANFRELVARIPVGVAKLTMPASGNPRLDFVSDRWAEQLGLTPQAMVETPQLAVQPVHPEDRATLDESVHAAAASRQPFSWEGRVVVAGQTRWVHVAASAVAQPDGSVVWNGIQYDVTDRKLAEVALHRESEKNRALLQELEDYRLGLEGLVDRRTAELKTAKQEADAASRAKSAFLANMSHEIRTPLNAVMGMAHLIKTAGLTPEQATRMGKLESAVDHLLSILNAILELSKIEAGKYTLSQSPVIAEALLANVVTMLGDRAKDRGLALRYEPSDVTAVLQGDPTALQQALLNYADNAIKFTPAGSVTLRALCVDDTPAEMRVRFEVEDTGVGIAPDVLPRLFNVFEQGDNSTTRRHGGTGLGLAITRQLAQLMGGEAGARSTAGVGSTFWFTAVLKKLPASDDGAGAALDDSDDTARSAASEACVLLAEDDEMSREVAAGMLAEMGLRTEVAVDGAEAVRLARARRYALILMDLHMPSMDGLAASTEIRRESKCVETPIIAMTANAFREDRERCLAAGMDDFLAKPVKYEELERVVRGWLGRTSTASAS